MNLELTTCISIGIIVFSLLCMILGWCMDKDKERKKQLDTTKKRL